MNIDYSWFTEKKKSGISWVARLRNSDDFLLEVIESHIPFLNEIILVDNVSSDSTKKKMSRVTKEISRNNTILLLPIWCKSTMTR
jgi:hypothetical protein